MTTSPRWQRCPHCDVFSALPDPAPSDLKCPGCAKPLLDSSPLSTAGEGSGVRGSELTGSFSVMKFCEFDSAHEKLSEAQVVPDAAICVQCGMCTYNCPMGIDVRAHAWRGKAIRDSHCLTCSECVNRCPRGVLRFERIPLFVLK